MEHSQAFWQGDLTVMHCPKSNFPSSTRLLSGNLVNFHVIMGKKLILVTTAEFLAAESVGTYILREIEKAGNILRETLGVEQKRTGQVWTYSESSKENGNRGTQCL